AAAAPRLDGIRISSATRLRGQFQMSPGGQFLVSLDNPVTAYGQTTVFCPPTQELNSAETGAAQAAPVLFGTLLVRQNAGRLT
ncbi:MAG: hypothetical protein Q8Q28_00130, partial [Pseudomonadota bacterium]|nr:hypothetical protein [Pseudomonadota bacterium]